MSGRFFSDDRLWPVVVQVSKGPQDLALHESMLAAWDACFARAEPIVMLRVYRDLDSLEHQPKIAKATKAWMQAGAAAAIRRYVAAMPIVVPAASHDKMGALNVERVFGVPGGIFPELAAACAWLRQNDFPVPDASSVAAIIGR